MKDHDRRMLARSLLARKLEGRRSTSLLADLMEFMLSPPVASAGMIAAKLKITQRAAQDLLAHLGLREAIGRGSFRAWEIL